VENCLQCGNVDQSQLQYDRQADGGEQRLVELPEYENRPYLVILHEAEEWNANLIVIGGHGRSGFDRAVMGSVSKAVALHAKCSVEIIRDAALALHERQRVP
jgi:nucleotide-binding universal stress UspA family protein